MLKGYNMDYHALQQKLFALDPTDPREDLAKLQAQAGSGDISKTTPAEPVVESYEAPEGSMPLDKDYSLSDFAALAGVTLNESQKKGSAGQLKAKQKVSKSPHSTSGEQKNVTRDKLVGEDGEFSGAFKQGMSSYNQIDAIGGDFNADKVGKGGGRSPQDKAKIKGSLTPQELGKKIGVSNPQLFNQAIMKLKQGQNLTRQQEFILAEAFKKLMALDPAQTQKVMMLLKRVEVNAEEQTMPRIKPRDPNAQTMQDIRKSGAMGAHKDKKKVLPRKEKHKGKQYETIKDMLYAKLAEKK